MYQKAHQGIDILGRACGAALAAFLIFGSAAQAAGSWNAFLNPDNSLSFRFSTAISRSFGWNSCGWGPRWAWVGVHSRQKAEGDRLSTARALRRQQGQGRGDRRPVRGLAAGRSAGGLPLRPGVGPGRASHHADRRCRLRDARQPGDAHPDPPDGKKTEQVRVCPCAASAGTGRVAGRASPSRRAARSRCRSILRARSASTTACAWCWRPTCSARASARVTLTLTFPEETWPSTPRRPTSTSSAGRWPVPTGLPSSRQRSWSPGVIDMDGWLDRPAGKHGGVRMVKDRFAFEDGTPVKFWGVNLSYTANAPDKETADFTAARFAKYGINAVRMHKFSYPTGQMGIGDPNDSTRMDPKGLDRLDYFVSKLKEHGVYFGWSHTYGFKVVPGDRKRLAGLRRDRQEPQGQHLRLHPLRRGRAGSDDRDGRQPAQAQEPLHRPDLRRRAGPVLPRAAERGRHLLLHVREGVQRLPDLQEALPGPVRGLAEGALRLAGEAQGGLGRCPAAGRDAGGRATSCRS